MEETVGKVQRGVQPQKEPPAPDGAGGKERPHCYCSLESLVHPGHVAAPSRQCRLGADLAQRPGTGLNEARDPAAATGTAGASGCAAPLATDLNGH